MRLACLAQLVNVIAPIFTNADGLFRQTIYYPYAWGLAHAKSEVLDLDLKAVNSFAEPKRVVPQPLAPPSREPG